MHGTDCRNTEDHITEHKEYLTKVNEYIRRGV